MNEPNEHRLGELTEREIEFLLLYAQPMLIKEIAYRCGVADVTVHKALESARKKLRVRSSRDAARLVLEWRDYRKTIGQPESLGTGAPLPKITSSDVDRDGPEQPREIGERIAPLRRRWRLVYGFGRDGVGLSLWERAAAIVLLAFLIVVTAGTLVTVGRGVAYAVAAAVRALS